MMVLMAQSRGGVRRSRLERANEVVTRREPFAVLSEEERNILIHEQSLMVELTPDEAISTLADLMPDVAERQQALDIIRYVAGSEAEMAEASKDRLAQLIRALDLEQHSIFPMTTNKTYDEIRIGDCAEINRRVERSDLVVFAHASGNFNPVHIPEDESCDPDKVAPSMWVGALFSAVLGNVLPGVGTLYRSQNLRFKTRAHLGDVLNIKVRALEKYPNREVKFTCLARLANGEVVAEGEAVVIAPDQSLKSEIETAGSDLTSSP